MQLEYPRLDYLIVHNSGDQNTFENLRENFGLRPVPRFPVSEVWSRKIEAPGDQKAVKVLVADANDVTVVGNGVGSAGEPASRQIAEALERGSLAANRCGNCKQQRECNSRWPRVRVDDCLLLLQPSSRRSIHIVSFCR